MTSPYAPIRATDEFDIDLRVMGIETGPKVGNPRDWTGDPPPETTTCAFSCQETCGGTCTCPGECFGS